MNDPATNKPLTGKSKTQERDQWVREDKANDAQTSENVNDPFAQLSKRFWSFARAAGAGRAADRSLSDIVLDIWRAKSFVMAGALCGVLAASLLIFLAVPATKTHMLLAPAQQLQQQGGATLASNNMELLRMLARQAGSESSQGFISFKELYKSAAIAAPLLKDPQVFAGLQADRRFIWGQGLGPATPEKLAFYISRHVHLDPVGASGLYSLSYWHPDPAFARSFLSKIHRRADEHIKNKAQDNARQRIAYLNAQITKSQNPDHRRVMTDLLLEQERLLMLSSINQPFAASIVENPASHYKAGWPPKTLLIALLFLLGGLVGYTIYFIKNPRAEG